MHILLAGDSTVTDQPVIEPYVFGKCYCGWGQVFRQFFDDQVQVCNYAISGYTVEAFRSGEYSQYDKLREKAKPGDYALIQFGHNDQKQAHLAPMGGYAQGLRTYIDELRAIGVQPVLVTPLCRNSWRGDNGEYNDLLAPCAEAMKVVAEEKDVPLLDLHKESKCWLQRTGREKAKRYFFPGDYTHPNGQGGVLFAGMVAACIRDSRDETLKPLRQRLLSVWPDGTVDDRFVRTSAGWVYPPASRCRFDFLQAKAFLTARQALQMARECYGFFVSVHTSAQEAEYEWWCAVENAYLPESYPQLDEADREISPAQFREVMLLACAGRNRITEEAERLIPGKDENHLTGEEAKEYAVLLEHLTTDAIMEIQQAGVPAGS